MPRDTRAEYRRRIELGLERGLTRSQARGHARAGEMSTRPRDDADRGMRAARDHFLKHGEFAAAAKAGGISQERLRRDLRERKLVEQQGGRLHPIVRTMLTYSRGRLLKLKLDEPNASLAGTYWNAVGHFVETNDAAVIAPFVGKSVTDLKGRRHPLETRLNVLHELRTASSGTFEQVYRLTVL